MAPSWRRAWVRFLAVALIGVAGLFIPTRPAAAAGCHAEDRPVLGVRLSWEVESPSTSVTDLYLEPLPAYRPVPCTDETARPSPRTIPGSPAASLPEVIEPVPAAGHFGHVSASSPAPPPRPAHRLDRPPRAR